jgi:hypothetical protein
MKIYYIVILSLLGSCNDSDFYKYSTGFDIYRIPILEPIELINSSEEGAWGVKGIISSENATFAGYRIDSLTATLDSLIIFKSNDHLIGTSHMEVWIVYDAKNKSSNQFYSLNALKKQIHIQNLHFKSPWLVYDKFKQEPSEKTIRRILFIKDNITSMDTTEGK